MSTESALAATQDLAFEVKALGRHEDVLGTREKSRVNRVGAYLRTPNFPLPVPGTTPGADWKARCWERDRMKEWKAAGRMTEDGVLRVPPPGTVKPWTLETITETWPHLNAWDRLAVLIELDGVVEEGYMDDKAQENIREVVQHYSREEVERALRTPEMQALVAERVHEQIGVMFGGILDMIKGGSTKVRPGVGKQNKCSKCHQPGHRATTCGRPPKPLGAGTDSAAAADE